MKLRDWSAGSGFLLKPWVIAGTAVGIVILAVLAASMMPWEEPNVVRTGHLPAVRLVPGQDREWGDTFVVSIDADGVIWCWQERGRDLREELQSFFEKTRVECEEDGTRWVRIGEVMIRAHRKSRWSDLRRVLAAVVEAGFPRVTIACRLNIFSAPERYFYLDLADVDWTWEWDPEEPEPNDESAREHIVLRSLDVSLAEPAGERITAMRQEQQAEGVGREPVFELAFPTSANAQSVYFVLECYALPYGRLSVVGLR